MSLKEFCMKIGLCYRSVMIRNWRFACWFTVYSLWRSLSAARYTKSLLKLNSSRQKVTDLGNKCLCESQITYVQIIIKSGILYVNYQ